MTNDGWRAQRAVKERHADAIPIGHLSLGFGHSAIIRERVRE
jgi:hypothetical protein